MFTTCTVPEPAAFVASPFSAAGPPHAATPPPAPPTAASDVAVRDMNARRVERPPPMSSLCITIVSPPVSGARSRAVDRRGVPRDQESLEQDHGEVEQEAEEGEHEDHREQRLGLQVVEARGDPVAPALCAAHVPPAAR